MGRRTVAELKKFYRKVMASDASLADRMRAAQRLQKLYDSEAAHKPTPAPAAPLTRDQALAAIASVRNQEKA